MAFLLVYLTFALSDTIRLRIFIAHQRIFYNLGFNRVLNNSVTPLLPWYG